MKGFGELPQGWISVPLEVVGRWGSGGTPKKGNNIFYGGNIPWLKIGDLTDGPVYSAEESITEIGLKQSSAKLLSENTVLLAMYGSIGKLGITKIECATNQAIAFCFHDEKLIELKYLFFGLLFLRQEFIAQGQGGTQQNISQTILKQTKLPLAPLAEQKRIVDKIETLFSDLDKGESLLKQVQQQLAVYRQSVLKEAVTGELTREWREQNKHRLESGEVLLQRILKLRRENWKGRGKYQEPVASDTFGLSKMPDGWCYCNVEQLAYVETGATPKKGNKLYYENGSIPWITSTAVNQDPINDFQSLITEKALRETNVKVFPKRTLILAMYGEGKTRGSVSELNIEAGTNQACAGLICEHLPYEIKCFLKLFLKYNYNLIRLESSGGVQPNLNLGIVKKTILPLPSTEEQNEIVDRINDIFSQIDALEKWCATELARSGMLRQSILRAAFSGELVPQDPEDEPASELLARIQAERASAARDKFKPATVR